MRPEAKLARLKALQAGGEIVVAVGDGINDAPLLRGADVAVAMGHGSALAQTSADLILVRDSLDELPAAVVLARRTQRVVRQNLGWSIAYNLAALADRRLRPRAAVGGRHRHVAEFGRGGAELDAPVALAGRSAGAHLVCDAPGRGRLT